MQRPFTAPRSRYLRSLILLTLTLLAPSWAFAKPVELRFDLHDPDATPFPSNLFAARAPERLTRLRVDLPFPDCDQQPTDCALISQLNTLDGFNLQPRLSIPFDGPIDPLTVTSENVFLLRLGGFGPSLGARRIGIDQVVWDPERQTLHVESGDQLDQHTRYALIVTRGVRDAQGQPIARRAFHDFFQHLWWPARTRRYARSLLYAAFVAVRNGLDPREIAGISVFTTQHATGTLEAVRDQIKAATPAPARFDLASDLGSPAHFAFDGIDKIVSRIQIGTDATLETSFETDTLFVEALAGGAVGSIAFGSFRSPSYRSPEDLMIPAEPVQPVVLDVEELFFNLILPAGLQPPEGWPVVVYAHGDGPGKNADPFFVGSALASQGLAVIAINTVGYGGGPLGTLTIEQSDGASVTFPAGGRGFDVDGDGTIIAGDLGVDEGYSGAFVPRDGRRQMAIDLMQLVRVIEVGVDIEGDGIPDLDPSRITFMGASLGGYHGPIFMAIEPNVLTGVVYAGGGSVLDLRLTPDLRPIFELLLASFEPPLTNIGDPQTCFEGGPCDLRFEESMPLRGQAPIIDPSPGAIAIQETLERLEWLDQTGNPATYAPHLRKRPLAGVPAKATLFQIARGDLQVPNFSTTAVLRAGDLADTATLYRHDLVFGQPDFPGIDEPDGHFVFIFPFFGPAFEALGVATQAQFARFLASDGAEMVDPDGAGPIFETPISTPLPEDCGFVIEIPGFTSCP